MESSMGVGFMAVFAVTGSVVILSLQIHKRLLSDFMKDIEFQLSGAARFGIGSVKRTNAATKKTVRFVDDVVEASSDNKEYRKKHLLQEQVLDFDLDNLELQLGKGVKNNNGHHDEDNMPLNRKALYRGIIASKSLKGQQYV